MTGKALLFIAGLVFVGVGAVHLASPQAGVAPLGLELITVNSLNEIRANYGGMHLILGLFMLAAAFRVAWQRPALLILALFTGGLTLGRVVSIAVDGLPENILLGFLVIEAVACLLAAVLLIKGAERQPA